MVNKTIIYIISTILILTILILLYFFWFMVVEAVEIVGKKVLTITTVQNPQFDVLINNKPWSRSNKGMRKEYPWTAAVVVNVDNNDTDEIFIGGGLDQDDALLFWDGKKLVDRIAGTGLSSKASTYGGVSIDLNNNGFSDLIIARSDGVTLYTNNGNGTFKGKKILEEQPDRIPVSVTVTDLNQDGNVDIYVSNFIRSNMLRNYQYHNKKHSKSNVLLQGLDNGSFRDVTETAGVAGNSNTFTSVFTDLNNDGYADLVLAQDAGEIEIYRNLGNGKFKREKIDSGFGFWMGIAAGDIDNDGDMDLFLTNISGYTPENSGLTDNNTKTGLKKGDKLNHHHILLRNDGNFKFTDISKDKLTGNDGIMGNYGFGWGAVFDDLDRDGNLDLAFSVNYLNHPIKFMRHSQPVLLNKNNDKKFTSYRGFDNSGFGHTPLLTDIDGDGIKDLMWINIKGPIIAYANKSWKDNAWINVRLPSSLRFANAKITMTLDDDTIMTRENIQGGIGFGSDQSELHSFGLGSGDNQKKPKSIEVRTVRGEKWTIGKPKLFSTYVLSSKNGWSKKN